MKIILKKTKEKKKKITLQRKGAGSSHRARE